MRRIDHVSCVPIEPLNWDTDDMNELQKGKKHEKIQFVNPGKKKMMISRIKMDRR